MNFILLAEKLPLRYFKTQYYMNQPWCFYFYPSNELVNIFATLLILRVIKISNKNLVSNKAQFYNLTL